MEELLILEAEASRELRVAVPTYLELEEPIQKSFSFYSAKLNEVFCGGRVMSRLCSREMGIFERCDERRFLSSFGG